MKQWLDLVLEYGWAYGPHGLYLKGKKVLNAITTGGSYEAYRSEGRNQYAIEDFLRPFEITAKLCQMKYLPPFHVAGTHKISGESLRSRAEDYKNHILKLRDE